MIFHPTPLVGAVVFEMESYPDERGFFARSWCSRELAAHGLPDRFVQGNISFSRRRGTLRGMHWQRAPHGETKLVRCIRGRMFDVIIDLRPASATFCQWFGLELDADGRKSLFVPAGFAHGFQTLEDDTEVSYEMGEFYAPDSACGVRWNDPTFSIEWPLPHGAILSARDEAFPDFCPSELLST